MSTATVCSTTTSRSWRPTAPHSRTSSRSTVPTDPAPPEGAVFHYGLFDYEVKVANAGDAADVKFILPSGPATTGVFMLQDGAWTEVTANSDIDDAAHEVTVGLEDGGLGDADHAADGVIDDPVGVAGQPNTITVKKVTSPSGLSGFLHHDPRALHQQHGKRLHEPVERDTDLQPEPTANRERGTSAPMPTTTTA